MSLGTKSLSLSLLLRLSVSLFFSVHSEPSVGRGLRVSPSERLRTTNPGFHWLSSEKTRSLPGPGTPYFCYCRGANGLLRYVGPRVLVCTGGPVVGHRWERVCDVHLWRDTCFGDTSYLVGPGSAPSRYHVPSDRHYPSSRSTGQSEKGIILDQDPLPRRSHNPVSSPLIERWREGGTSSTTTPST